MKGVRELALVGPTAGILPTVLFDHGATAVATVKVKDANKVMKNISEGGGVPFGNAVKLVIYRPASRAGRQDSADKTLDRIPRRPRGERSVGRRRLR